MLTIGISISRERVGAVALEGDGSSARVAAVAEHACSEPFGNADDAAALARELARALPGKPLPGAVITLPPALTYIRPVHLPVSDLARARAIHIAELEGNLPVDDEEILSDLLPPPAETSGTFLAVASRRSFVERTVEAFGAAGLRVDRVVTDHVALLLLGAASDAPKERVLLAAFPDLLLLRVSGGGVLAARQFPSALADSPEEILAAVREVAQDGSGVPAPVLLFGDVPKPLAAGIAQGSAVPARDGLSPALLPAYGAALVQRLPKAAAGFSLRTSAEEASEREREKRWTTRVLVAGGAAILLSLCALWFGVWTEGQKAAKARALVRKEFAEAAPDVRNVVQAGAQIKEKVASMRRQQKELGTDAPPPADILMRASQSLPQGEIAVREAAVEGARLRLGGEAKEAKLVEAYRSALAGTFGPGWTVAVQESEGTAKGGSIRFTILVERKGDARVS
jgi:hypothetical protein